MNEKRKTERKEPPKLSDHPLRDLSDRECANIIGWTLGGMTKCVSDVKTIRKAFEWWANNDAAWKFFEELNVTPWIINPL